VIVADANAWVNYLIGALDEVHVLQLLNTESVTGPPHVDFEVGSALIRHERHGLLGEVPARDLMEAFTAMPFDRIRHADDLTAAFDLLNNATYADAIYVAMAKRLSCPIMTGDKGMIECARIAAVDIIDTINGQNEART
jgi:predicted nucleic acid-binding protein